jgi:hypothetical protein
MHCDSSAWYLVALTIGLAFGVLPCSIGREPSTPIAANR